MCVAMYSRQPRRVGVRVMVDGVSRYSESRAYPGEFIRSAQGEWVVKDPFRIRLSATP